MLFKERLDDYRMWIGTGSILLIAAIFLERFAPSLRLQLSQGFTDGLAVVFVTLSICFSLRGLRIWQNSNQQ